MSGATDRTSDVNPHALVEAPSPYTLMAGSIISASLITGLNSDLPGLVTAQVTENAYDSVTGHILLIPQGSRLIGSYDSVVAFGQKRALLVWQRIILPDGASVRIDNVPATDTAGYAGLSDKVDVHTWQLLKGVALSTLLGCGHATELRQQRKRSCPRHPRIPRSRAARAPAISWWSRTSIFNRRSGCGLAGRSVSSCTRISSCAHGRLWRDEMPEIKLAKLPDRTPVKLTVSIMPDLHRALEDYACVYERMHGVAEPIAELVPAILANFLETDRGFAKARRELIAPATVSNNGSDDL